MLLVGAIIGFIVADRMSSTDATQERIDYYEQYYKDLSPSTFKVKKNGNKIEIEIKHK